MSPEQKAAERIVYLADRLQRVGVGQHAPQETMEQRMLETHELERLLDEHSVALARETLALVGRVVTLEEERDAALRTIFRLRCWLDELPELLGGDGEQQPGLPESGRPPDPDSDSGVVERLG